MEILKLREHIRARDNYKCQDCGILQEDNKRLLDVHHIDWNSSNNKESNLIALCRSCHLKVKDSRKILSNKIINVRMPKKMKDRLFALAKAKDIGISYIVKCAITKMLKKKQSIKI